MNKIFKEDYKRYAREDWSLIKGYLRILKHHGLRIQYYGRKALCSKSKLLKKYYNFCLRACGKKYGIEIGFENIEKGLLLVHPFNITVASYSKLGQNVTLFKGITIGSIRSGPRNGVPQIGDRVTICANAFVAGNIIIGDDVLIAANSFVNFDVPSNSIVIGNIIKHKENPSKDYL